MHAVDLLDALPTHRRTLDNGLTVVAREDRSSPVVAVVTHVKAGYFTEPDAVIGISHVLEHMFFKGTERRRVGDIARETKQAGGYLNAGTIYDYTSYYTVLPASSLEQGLDLQADALRHSQIDEQELRRELEVIVQEAKRKLDNPSAVASETLYELLFDVHRMRRWRIGTEAGLRRLTRADVWEYYRALYRPSNIVVVVVGDVDAEAAFALAQRYYGDMPRGEVAPDTSPLEPQRSGLRVRELIGDVTQLYLEWGWRTPGTLHADTPSLDVLALVLGQGRASRLYRGVREGGLASSIGAYNYTPTDIGVFGISAELPADDALAALDATWAEVALLQRVRPTAAELERAHSVLEARLLRRLETVEGQASLLAEWEALGDWRLAGDYVQRLLATTPADVARAAAQYLPLDGAALVAYRPVHEGALELDAATLRERLAHAGLRAAAGVPDQEELAPAAAAAEPRTGAARAVRLDGALIHELQAGARIVVLPRPDTALVALGFLCRGGVLNEPAGLEGISSLVTRTAIKGTATRSGARIALESEILGGAVTGAAGADLVQWSISVPGRHVDRGIDLLLDVALRPAFAAADVQREREVALSALQRLRDDMYRYPLRLFLECAFAEHPYGQPVATIEQRLRAFERANLEEWHRAHVLEAAPWLIVVGDVDAERVMSAAAARLAMLPPGAAAPAVTRPSWPAATQPRVERRGKAQTALCLGFPGPSRQHPDIYALEVLSNALNGLGGRFFDELRERRALAYTVAAYPLVRWLAGAFIAYIAMSPEKEQESRRALLDGFDELAAHGLTVEELDRSKRYTIGAWKIRNQTNGAMLSELADALLFGRGLEEIREFESRIDDVSPDGVRSALERWYARDRIVEGIVRGTGDAR
ncbi:MAG: M16 family metallopeptidase [Longimicrobiales bacterium]